MPVDDSALVGAPAPLARLIRRTPGEPRLAIRSAEVSIGRGAENDLVVDDPTVGVRHARLRLDGGVWILADLGSVHGTGVDGEPALGPVPLATGSVVRLGGVEMVFEPLDRWQDSAPGGRAATRSPLGSVILPLGATVAGLALGAVGHFVGWGG